MAKKSTAVLQPTLGLFLDRQKMVVPLRGLQDGLNFRIRHGKLTNHQLGWLRFSTFTLDGPVRAIATFTLRAGTEYLLFATNASWYLYSSAGVGSVAFLNRRYETGTASSGGTAVLGVGTLWSTNVAVGDYIHFGATGYADPTGTWYPITVVTDDTHLTISPTSGVVVDGAYTIRKSFTSTITDVWDYETFLHAPANADLFFITNGVDPVQVWDGSATQFRLATINPPIITAKRLAVYSNMMQYFDLETTDGLFPSSMINSNPGEPENVTTGLAEQFLLYDTADPILDVQPLGDNFVVYAYRTIVIGQFVGDPLVFAFRKIGTGVGVVGYHLVANFGDYHEFIGQDSQYKFDGGTVKPSGEQVWRVVANQRDATRIQLGFHHFDEENAELLWVLALNEDLFDLVATTVQPPSTAYPEHYLANINPQIGEVIPFSKRDFPFMSSGLYSQQSTVTWANVAGSWDGYDTRWNEQSLFAAFPLNLVGNAQGNVFILNASETADGAALASFVKFPRKALGDGRMRGLLSRIYPFATSPTGVSGPLLVTVHLSDHEEGPATIDHTDNFDLTLPEGNHFTTPYRRGRYYELEFGTAGPNQPWELAGYDTDGKIGGRR